MFCISLRCELNIQALQESRLIDNRKHWQFYCNPLYISMMYIEFAA
nr:MAG TPA: hypothetical protein [Caudoviricetes sp.]